MEQRSLSVRLFPPRLPTALTRDGWWLCPPSPTASVCIILPFACGAADANRPAGPPVPPTNAGDST